MDDGIRPPGNTSAAKDVASKHHPYFLIVLGDPISQQFLYYNVFDNNWVPYYFTNIPGGGPIKILQSCNGLLLLKTRNKDFFVYNPATRKSRKLSVQHKKHVCGLRLAFDPPSHDVEVEPHYKVFCVRRTLGSWRKVDVYDSRNHQWTALLRQFPESWDSFDQGYYWNKCIYWISRSRRGVGSDSYHVENLMWLNVENSLSGSAPLILPTELDASVVCLLESNGHLYFLACTRDGALWPLYELERNRRDWILQGICVSKDLTPDILFDQYRSRITLIGTAPGEEGDDSMNLVLGDRDVVHHIIWSMAPV